ncbi:DUF695 domain-containing protein [Pseudoxanthomonas mexicana]
MLKLMLLVALIALNPVAQQDQRIWAIAVAKHQTLDRSIVYRYVQEFEPGFDKQALPIRIDIHWDYASPSGMPSDDERDRMDAAENAFSPSVEQDGAAALVYVETGEGRRQWSFYARSEDEFIQRFNDALSSSDVLPIQVDSVSDPKWTLHAEFLDGVKPKEQE